jgi:hypothetical protein
MFTAAAAPRLPLFTPAAAMPPAAREQVLSSPDAATASHAMPAPPRLAIYESPTG